MVGSANPSDMIALIKSNEEQRTIAKSTFTHVVCQGPYVLWVEFTFSPLRVIEQLIHIEADTDPEMNFVFAGLPQDKKYGIAGGMAADNIVGATLAFALGTTIVDCVNGTTLTLTGIGIGF